MLTVPTATASSDAATSTITRPSHRAADMVSAPRRGG
jgi:hypothetical protein